MPDTLSRAVIDSLLPEGKAWEPVKDGDFDSLLEGISENSEYMRLFLAKLARINNPQETPILSDLERERGVIPQDGLTEQQRRDRLDAIIAKERSTGAFDFLQDRLQENGFNVQVHVNDPPVDPDLFINRSFRMVAAGYNAYAGHEDAYAGFTGEEYIVNGIGYEFYATPSDPGYWPSIFFVGGDATRNGSGELTAIATASVDAERRDEFIYLVARYKPHQTWAGAIVGYV